MQFYLNPEREQDPYALPDAETFQFPEDFPASVTRINNGSGDLELKPGWYWWACFPGRLPDGEPIGPFETEALAISNAQEESEEG